MEGLMQVADQMDDVTDSGGALPRISAPVFKGVDLSLYGLGDAALWLCTA
jgi:hypothetical protein